MKPDFNYLNWFLENIDDYFLYGCFDNSLGTYKLIIHPKSKIMENTNPSPPVFVFNVQDNTVSISVSKSLFDVDSWVEKFCPNVGHFLKLKFL